MPKHTALTVSLRCSCGGSNSLTHGEILVICAEYFRVAGKTNEVLDYIKQPCLVEHSLNESVKLGVLRIFIATVLSFPFHKAVFA